MSEDLADELPTVGTVTGPLRTAAAAGLVLVVVVGGVLRFVTHSALWLDEALTVDIARLPLHEIPHYLRHDGAPPLFYFLLHFWMQLFGNSDLAVRSLSGVIGLLTLVVAWFCGQAVAGRAGAWTTLALVASAPFAVYYSTEARMYSLVILLTGCGFLALRRALAAPRPGNLVAVAAVAAGLLYSQYWSLYLVAAVGILLIAWILLGRFRSPGPDAWKRPVPALGAVAVGAVAFLPWVPTFLYQSAHTGTPWATPSGFGAIVNMVTGFTFNQGVTTSSPTVWGRVLALAYLGLAALALFGIGRSAWVVELDWRTRPRARALTFVVAATLVFAITGGLLSASTFSPRYAAVVFLPLLLLVTLGSTRLLSPVGRLTVVTATVAAGLLGSFQNINTQRTQAASVAAVINAHARPGDLVVLCPDQLGPAVYRETRDPGRLDMTTFPRGTGPQIVDWVDYATAVHSSNPVTFGEKMVARAGSDHHIWAVWQSQYQVFGTECEQLVSTMQQGTGVVSRQWVTSNQNKYYEPMNLYEISRPPATGTAAPR